MIILVGSEKGGTGKTTLAINLYLFLKTKIEDILLVDTDPQGSASNFTQIRDDARIFPRIISIQKFGKNLAKDILDLSNKYKIIIIDAGGRDSIELRYSLGISNILLTPTKTSQFDLWSLEKMEGLLEEVMPLNPKLRSYAVFNMVSTNPNNSDINKAISFLKQFNYIKILKNNIKERVVYQRSIRKGISIFEYLPKNIKAINELNLIFKEFTNDK